MIQRQANEKIELPHGEGHLLSVFALACRPKAALTVSEWADQNRILTAKSSGEPGRWRTSRNPALKEVMDSLSARSRVQRIVMMFAAQLGKTEVGLNWIGYMMEHDPCSMLAVVPTLEVRKRWVRQRLDPLLNETPALQKIFDAKRNRDGSNSEDMKDFPGGILIVGASNSAASLASMPIKNVLCDEVDRFPWDVGQEGDPLGLIDERTKTFPRRKVLLVSTPTVKGMSRIEMEYERSDMREYHVPCPECHSFQVLKWKHSDGTFGLTHSKTTGAVWYACRECGFMIDEHHKTKMLERGRWIPKAPENTTRGYRLSGLYSPIGLGFSWAELWQQWQDAHRDTSNLKRFVNTTLGESWEEQGDGLEDVSLLMRREAYIRATLNYSLITAGIDIQKDRIEFTVFAWGHQEESWAIDHVIVDGDTAGHEVWDDLSDALKDAGVQVACIDAGYNTSLVYAFCEKRKWCIPTKGISGAGRPLIEDERKRLQRKRHRNRRGFSVEPIGVDQGKAILYSRLKMMEPGPGFIHFPIDDAFDDEYFAQIAAEKLVTDIKAGRPVQVWKTIRARNEALDCAILALAAMRLSGRTQKQPQDVQPKPEEISNDPKPTTRDPMAYALAQRSKLRRHR